MRDLSGGSKASQRVNVRPATAAGYFSTALCFLILSVVQVGLAQSLHGALQSYEGRVEEWNKMILTIEKV